MADLPLELLDLAVSPARLAGKRKTPLNAGLSFLLSNSVKSYILYMFPYYGVPLVGAFGLFMGLNIKGVKFLQYCRSLPRSF